MEAALSPNSNSESNSKAEDWLLRVANDIEGVWDQEALVYLRSRGHDCHDEIADLIQTWKVAEKQRLDEYNERVGKKRGVEANATNIADIPRLFLRDFWDGAPPEDYSFEAIMLRTVDWCEIAGFDAWWHRLEETLKESTFSHESTNLLPYWLFNMVRSDYAIKLIRRVLERYVELISSSGPNKPEPWMFRADGSGSLEENFSHASTIVFAHHRLNLVHSDPQPGGWPRIAARARDWLWSAQQEDGSWTEPGTPGPTHLTVLVLDAIALANGERNVTFRWPSNLPETYREQRDLSGQASGLAVVSTMASRAKPRGLRTALHVSKWDEIEITFLSEGRVQIRCGQETETCNFGDLGFTDGRTKQPRRAWIVLQIMAESSGVIRDTQKTHGKWPMVEKRMQEIRELLRQYFGLSGDPVPYAPGNGYRTRFRIARAPSYDS